MHFLYGPNEPLIHGIWTELSQNIKGKAVSEEALISGDYQIGAPSLFEAAPEVVFVPKVSHVTWATTFVDQIPSGYTAVLVGSSASPAMVRSPKIAVSSCYECPFEDSKIIAQRYAQKEGLSFGPQAFGLFAQWTREGQWAQASRNLRLCEESPLSTSTVEVLMNMPSEEKSAAIITGKIPAELGAEDPLKTIRSWQRLICQLWQFKVNLSENMTPDQSIQEINPPLFFKHKPLLMAHHSRWTVPFISHTIQHLLEQEILLKQDPARGLSALTSILLKVQNFIL